MPRKTTKIVDETIVDEQAPVEVVEEVKEPVEKKVSSKVVEEKVEEKPLTDSDKIRVVALVPNVRYLDSYTRDHYKWNNVGDEVYMKFGELERMWRNTKGYFRSMWLKPDDPRVIREFGLEGIYKKNDFLEDVNSYTYDNISKICNAIDNMDENDMKYATCSKIKNFVATGKLNDIRVIRALEEKLGIDLSSAV